MTNRTRRGNAEVLLNIPLPFSSRKLVNVPEDVSLFQIGQSAKYKGTPSQTFRLNSLPLHLNSEANRAVKDKSHTVQSS